MQASIRSVLLAALLLTLALPLSMARGALHLRLIDSAPAEDALLEEPPHEVRLFFSQKPELAIARIALTGPGGEVALGEVQEDEDDELFAAIEDEMSPGEYEVSWRTSSADGHPIRGTYTFTITAVGGPVR